VAGPRTDPVRRPGKHRGVLLRRWCASVSFDRPGAYDETQKIPDIDLLVPREHAAKLEQYAERSRNSDFPVKIETVNGYVDYRPDQPHSYLTHRDLKFPVPTELFSPSKAAFLGQEITTVDPRVLLHSFGTIGGVIRKKDVPKIVSLAEAIGSGKAPSRFTENDCAVFSRYMITRKRRYPVFITGKATWEGLLAALPDRATHAIKHHLTPMAQEAIARMNSRNTAPKATEQARPRTPRLPFRDRGPER
jgi:hypothetical protein